MKHGMMPAALALPTTCVGWSKSCRLLFGEEHIQERGRQRERAGVVLRSREALVEDCGALWVEVDTFCGQPELWWLICKTLAQIDRTCGPFVELCSCMSASVVVLLVLVSTEC